MLETKFLAMAPRIHAAARRAFHPVNAEAKEDLIAEVIANAYCAFCRLVERGKEDLAYATPLARYAIRQVRAGRRVGSKLNVRDLDYARQVQGLVVERLSRKEGRFGEWRDALVEDRKAGPAETAAARIDLANWLGSLRRRERRIAQTLARGESTGAVARMFGVSPARISQLRWEFKQSWAAFHGEPLDD